MTTSIRFFLLLPAFILAFAVAPDTYAQNVSPGEKYNLIVSDQTLGAVLDQLSRTAGVTFSYNPDQIGINRKISLRITQKTLPEIMEQLFDSGTFDFRQKGNQIVIFSRNAKETDRPASSITENFINESSGKTDTVYVVKERLVTETLTRVDTLIKRDTLYIVEKQPENKIGSKDIFRNNPPMYARLKPELSVDAGLKVAALFSHRNYKATDGFDELLEAYIQADSGFAFSGSVGIALNLNYNRLTFTTGLDVVQLAHRFNYNFITATGGYYLKDTLDKYYTLSNSDTTWFYLVDSSYLPEDTKQFRYNTTVKYRYLDFPLMIQYNLPVARNLFYFNAGIIAGVSVGRSGYYLANDNQTVAELTTLKNRPILFSAKVGAGISLPVSSKLVLNAGVHYRQALQSIYRDFEVKTYPTALGADVSLMLRL